MHHFSSAAFSLLVIIGQHVSVQFCGTLPKWNIRRPYKSFLTVDNGMTWGSWGITDMCPPGTYAAGFSLKVEQYSDGFWDDNTALNGIRLHCVDPSNSMRPQEHFSTVESEVGSWGEWMENQWCPDGFLTAFQLNVEASQGIDDDTSVNSIRFKCSEGSWIWSDIKPIWGTWGDSSKTCEGKGICGLRTRVEEAQGMGDDTALNDVIMLCCD